MKEDVLSAYKMAFYLSELYLLELVRKIRTHTKELMIIRGFNAVLLLMPILLWIVALFRLNWLLWIPMTALLMVLALRFLFQEDTPEEPISPVELANYEGSDTWLELKEQVLYRDKFRCRVCRSREDLRVERISDRHITHERLHELITICEHCYTYPTKF